MARSICTSWITPPPGRLVLPSSAVDIWHTHLSSLNQQDESSLLSPDEVRKASSFSSNRRRQFTSGRIFLRKVLSRYFNESPQFLQFEYGLRGKPQLHRRFDSKLHFNLSHTGNDVALALSSDIAVGIDIERADRAVRNIHSLTKKYMTEEETRSIEEFYESDEKGAMRQFLYLWTRKEALAKAFGHGISSTFFSTYDVVGQPWQAVREGRKQLAEITLTSFNMNGTIVGATAALTPNATMRFFHS